eukprot:gnl/MRDRNA2_/MRDRNA2_113237_c0_seq1.p1 gnl/MRDRNA2_/MRDRNA2_113237_c0~~gnl/MRDRNA2_/MRDRNA2_113237_c0_seq1.p1  ORF type:complete len:496 (+),score=113.53 gnl/MRDRNA2_/MRDRNA2_113237_c0_seq1:92-1579(+)
MKGMHGLALISIGVMACALIAQMSYSHRSRHVNIEREGQDDRHTTGQCDKSSHKSANGQPCSKAGNTSVDVHVAVRYGNVGKGVGQSQEHKVTTNINGVPKPRPSQDSSSKPDEQSSMYNEAQRRHQQEIAEAQHQQDLRDSAEMQSQVEEFDRNAEEIEEQVLPDVLPVWSKAKVAEMRANIAVQYARLEDMAKDHKNAAGEWLDDGWQEVIEGEKAELDAIAERVDKIEEFSKSGWGEDEEAYDEIESAPSRRVPSSKASGRTIAQIPQSPARSSLRMASAIANPPQSPRRSHRSMPTVPAEWFETHESFYAADDGDGLADKVLPVEEQPITRGGRTREDLPRRTSHRERAKTEEAVGNKPEEPVSPRRARSERPREGESPPKPRRSRRALPIDPDSEDSKPPPPHLSESPSGPPPPPPGSPRARSQGRPPKEPTVKDVNEEVIQAVHDKDNEEEETEIGSVVLPELDAEEEDELLGIGGSSERPTVSSSKRP